MKQVIENTVTTETTNVSKRKYLQISRSKHFEDRKKQRGFSKDEIALILDYGTPLGEKIVLGKREIKKLLKWKSRPYYKVLTRLQKKNGAVVVIKNNQLVTVYNINKMPLIA